MAEDLDPVSAEVVHAAHLVNTALREALALHVRPELRQRVETAVVGIVIAAQFASQLARGGRQAAIADLDRWLARVFDLIRETTGERCSARLE